MAIAPAASTRPRARRGTGRKQPSFARPKRIRTDRRPLVVRTSGSATEGVYGLILAASVIAVSHDHHPSNAGPVALAVLITALIFWLAHVYAHLLGRAVSHARRPTRTELAHALPEHSSIVEVVVPLVVVLACGAIGVIPDRAAFAAATGIVLVELAAAGAYAAARRAAGPRGIIASAAVAVALGLVVVLLKVLVH